MVEAPLAISVSGVKKSYGNVPVLRSLNMDLKQREILAVLGKSGCGKSTLLKCIAGIERIDEGNISYFGQEYVRNGVVLFDRREVSERIMIVFQDFALFPNMTGLRNITLPLIHVKGLSEAKARNVAEQYADRLGVSHVLQQYPSEMSGGQAQRVALVRTLTMKPQVLLLDEITANLDPESIANVISALREFRRTDTGELMSVIVVTHLLRFARDFSDRIVFISEGSVVENHPAGSFATGASHPEALSFLKSMTADFG